MRTPWEESPRAGLRPYAGTGASRLPVVLALKGTTGLATEPDAVRSVPTGGKLRKTTGCSTSPLDPDGAQLTFEPTFVHIALVGWFGGGPFARHQHIPNDSH